MDMGNWKAGYAVATLQESSEAEALPTCTSVQKVKLLALPQVLRWGKGKRVNSYTDSKYAFTVVHGAIWRRRALFTLGGKEIKHSQEASSLLKAAMKPKKAVIMIHCPGHQETNGLISQ